MKSLEEIVEYISGVIQSRESVVFTIGDHEQEVLLEDVFLDDKGLQLQYSFRGEVSVLPLEKISAIGGVSVYDILGLSQNQPLFSQVNEREQEMDVRGERLYGVKEITWRIKSHLEGDEGLQDVWVKGEIVNFSQSSVGHVYFSLKEEDNSLGCVYFEYDGQGDAQIPKNGDFVEVLGDVRVYDKRGIYQLIVKKMLRLGFGEWYGQYEVLKKRLISKGYFEIDRKKRIPKYPTRLGVITSKTGAALQDILRVLDSTPVDVYVYSTAVQGNIGLDSVCEMLKRANEEEKVDLILLARGGGSSEDLWVFNEEQVIECIVQSALPVMTAIGHETDRTLSDEVGDFRFSTPTAAAHFIAQNYYELGLKLTYEKKRMIDNTLGHFDRVLEEVEFYAKEKLIKEVMFALEKKEERVDALREVLIGGIRQFLEIKISGVEESIRRMEYLSAQNTLKRGYILLLSEDGKMIRSAKELKVGMTVMAMFHDGKRPLLVSTDERQNSGG